MGRGSSAVSLNEEQQAVVDAKDGVFVVLAGPGSGKCLGIGTPVLLFNGEIRKVEELRVGDLLMGPDSLPRKILSTTRSLGPLYRVTPTKGDSFVCNDAHILVLDVKKGGPLWNKIHEVSVQKFLTWPRSYRTRAKLCRTGVDFPNAQRLSLDPYFLGLWLGDGDARIKGDGSLTLTVADYDIETISYLKQLAIQYDLQIRERPNSENSKKYSLTSGKISKGDNPTGRNSLLTLLQENQDLSFKNIPQKYKTASRNDRLKLLAGLIDSDGYGANGCRINTK